MVSPPSLYIITRFRVNYKRFINKKSLSILDISWVIDFILYLIHEYCIISLIAINKIGELVFLLSHEFVPVSRKNWQQI